MSVDIKQIPGEPGRFYPETREDVNQYIRLGYGPYIYYSINVKSGTSYPEVGWFDSEKDFIFYLDKWNEAMPSHWKYSRGPA